MQGTMIGGGIVTGRKGLSVAYGKNRGGVRGVGKMGRGSIKGGEPGLRKD